MMVAVAWGFGGFSGQLRYAQAWDNGAQWLVTPTPEPAPAVNSPVPLSAGTGESAWPALDPDCTDNRCVFAVQANAQDVSRFPATCAYSTTVTPPEIYLGQCASGERITAGFLFSGVHLPQGAALSRAYLVFNVDGPYTQPLQLRLYGEASANAVPFYPGHPNPDYGAPENRSLTQAQVAWTITQTWLHQAPGHAPYASPDVTAIVQEIVSYEDWVTGNSMAFIVRDESPAGARYHRRVYAYEREGLAKSARLVVELASPTPPPALSIAITDAQGDDVTALALNDDGWPVLNAATGAVANPLTVTVTLDVQNTFSPGMLEMDVAGQQWQSRFYPVRGTSLCQTSVMFNSYQSWSDACLVTPGMVWTGTWQIWVQPSSADVLKFSATYSGTMVETQVGIPTAKISPVVFLPGLGATNPPSYAPMPYANRMIVDGLLALGGHVGRYTDLYNALERLGYERDKTYFLFPYNWLKDVSYSAHKLRDELLVPAANQVALTVPYAAGYQSSLGQGVKFDLVGHSTGNLVARAYMQGDDALWQGYVRRFVSLAGPHKGLPKSYVLLEGVNSEGNTDTIGQLALFYARGDAWFAGYRTWGPESRYLYIHDPVQGPTSIAGFLPTYVEIPYLTATIAFPYGRYANPLFENAPPFDFEDVTDGRYDPYFHNPYSAVNLRGRYSPELLRQTFEHMYRGLNTPEKMSLLYSRIGDRYGTFNNVCLVYAGERNFTVTQEADSIYDTRVQLTVSEPSEKVAPFWWLGTHEENLYGEGDRFVPSVSGGAMDIWAGLVVLNELDNHRRMPIDKTAEHGSLPGYGITHHAIAQCLLGFAPEYLYDTPSGDTIETVQPNILESTIVLTQSRMLAIMAIGPVEFQLRDSLGRRLGDDGTTPLVAWPTIPLGSYVEEEKVGAQMSIPYPLASTYTLTVHGVGDGEFSLLVWYGDNTGQVDLFVLDKDTIRSWQTRTFQFTVPIEAGDVSKAPEIFAGWEYEAIPGEIIELQGYATDINPEDELDYTWLFGDGQSQSGDLTPLHAYATSGVYTATLIVTDITGLVTTDTVQVIVEP